MADFQEIGLQPVARPTDQYVGPNVTRSTAGSQAMQLAAALKGFSKDAEEVFNRRFDAYTKASEAQADRIDAQGVYKNQEQLKAAVARGELPAHSNPWLMVRLRQNIARGEALDAAAAAHNDLRQSDVFHQDSPEAVSQFVDQKLAPTVQGRDAWEIAAMQPELDKARHNIMADWMDTRGQERIHESRAMLGSIVAKRTDEWNATTALALQHGDPNASKALEGMVGDLQEELKAQGAVVDWATANQWFTESVLQAARDKRDPALAQYILDRIETKGGVLSKTSENRAALDRLPREIAELKNADARSEIEARRLDSTKQAMDLVDHSGKLMAEQGKANILDVDVPTTDIQQKSPLVWAEYQKMVASMASDYQSIKNSDYMRKLDPLTAEAFGKAARGELSQPDSMKLVGAMALLGEPGRQASEGFTRFLYHQKNAEYGPTKPETLIDLNKALMSGTLTEGVVLEAARNLSLDQNDTQTYLKLASQLQSSGGATARQTAPVQETLRQLSDLIEHPYLEGGLIGGSGGSMYADQMKDKQAQAETAFLKEYYGKLVKDPTWDKLPYTEQHKQIEELRDSIAKSYGGPTMQDFLRSRPEAQPKPEAFKPVVKPVLASQQSETGTKPVSELAPVPDPFAADLDKSVLRTVRQALTHKPNATTREAIDAAFGDWRDTFEAMHGVPGQVGVLAEGRYGKYGLGDISQLEDLRTRNADKIAGNTDESIQPSELATWTGAMARLQALKPDATAAKQTIQSLTAAYQQSGTITIDQQQQLKAAALTVLSFQELRDHVGYSPDEVKQAGDGAWRSMPMFANPLDLKSRGPEVMKGLGVKDFQAAAFYESQLRMLRTLRESNTFTQ